MSTFLEAIKRGAILTDGAMGSYLFELTGRLSEANHVYEAFNLDQPDLVRKVHQAYLEAGARCLKTNTFGANCEQLLPHGMTERTGALNRAGVERAREAIDAHSGGDAPVFVLGSIGPASSAVMGAQAMEACYREQVEALTEAGADALLLETFRSLPQLLELLKLIQTLDGVPPVIAEMTVGAASGSEIPSASEFLALVAEHGASVAGVNCCAPWDADDFVNAAVETDLVRDGRLHLVVMPNAGGFQRIGNRFMTSVNPEFAGRMARHLMDRGVRLIGGCCEMHPPHIREMRNYLQSRAAAEKGVAITVGAADASVGDEEKKGNGPFSRKLKEGQFAVSIEMLPPRGTDQKISQRKVDFVKQLAESGLADAVDFTDGSRGIPLMPPGDFVHLLRARLEWNDKQGDRLELIPHFTGRDLNIMGIQSRLIGYHANGIHNVLFVTGDPPKMSPTYPRSTAVFDADSVALIRMTHGCLNAGVDFGGSPLGKHEHPQTHFTMGTGFEPESLDPVRELRRLDEKVEAGADYVMTQPAFRGEPLSVLEPYRPRIPILVGVMILTSYDQARRVAQVPGVVVPDAVLERIAAGSTPDDQAKIGQEIAVEQVQTVVREGWSGLYLMSPSNASGILDVLQAGL